MTALDIIVLLLVGGIGVRGLMRGFVTEAVSLIAWVAAIIAVKLLHAPLSASLAGAVGTEGGAAVLAFALIFGITFMIGRYVANRLGKASKSSVLGPFDRLLGLGFGAACVLGRSLWAAIFMHATNNALVLVLVRAGYEEAPKSLTAVPYAVGAGVMIAAGYLLLRRAAAAPKSR